MNEDRDRGLIWAVVSMSLAVAASAFFALYPTTSTSVSSSVSVSPNGHQGPVSTVVHHSTRTLLSQEGPSVLIVLAVPVGLAVAAIAVSRTRRRQGIRVVLACLLGVGCLLGAMTVGLFYVPAAGALAVCAALTTSRHEPVSRLAPTR